MSSYGKITDIAWIFWHAVGNIEQFINSGNIYHTMTPKQKRKFNLLKSQRALNRAQSDYENLLAQSEALSKQLKLEEKNIPASGLDATSFPPAILQKLQKEELKITQHSQKSHTPRTKKSLEAV